MAESEWASATTYDSARWRRFMRDAAVRCSSIRAHSTWPQAQRTGNYSYARVHSTIKSMWLLHRQLAIRMQSIRHGAIRAYATHSARSSARLVIPKRSSTLTSVCRFSFITEFHRFKIYYQLIKDMNMLEETRRNLPYLKQKRNDLYEVLDLTKSKT